MSQISYGSMYSLTISTRLDQVVLWRKTLFTTTQDGKQLQTAKSCACLRIIGLAAESHVLWGFATVVLRCFHSIDRPRPFDSWYPFLVLSIVSEIELIRFVSCLTSFVILLLWISCVRPSQMREPWWLFYDASAMLMLLVRSCEVTYEQACMNECVCEKSSALPGSHQGSSVH